MKKIIFFTIIIVLLDQNQLVAFENGEKIYLITSEEQKNVPREYYSFLEGVSHQLNYKELAEANWTSKMNNPQSFYDGYWVRLKIKNKLDEVNLGLVHRWNFEKRIIYKNFEKIYSFPLVRSIYNNYTHRSEDRLWYNYKIIMPKDEPVEIYSYFRSQPLDRNQIFEGGLDWMAIGLWQDIEFNEVMRLLGYVVMISMLICFSLYFLFYFLVSKERSYLWISITLLVGLYPFITWILSSTFGVRLNYIYGAIGLSVMSIVLIKFFQNLLSFKQIFPKTYNVYDIITKFYILCALVYFYDSLQYPNTELYKNIIKYPHHPWGVGTIPMNLALIPIGLILVSAVCISYLLWRRGDKVAKFLFFTFLVPVVIFPTAFIDMWFLFETGYTLKVIKDVVQVFAFLLILIMLGMALAQKLNDMKQSAIDLLEEKVLSRTKALTEANQLITKSIDSASMIQNAILPKFDHPEHGFDELKYIWMPRDVVGGDFYWVGKKENWTCLVVADCTGHGIPGAFMTLISTTLLNRVKEIVDLSQPDQILNSLDFLLEETLKFDENRGTEFGLDGGVCCFSDQENLLRFAGAKMNLYYKVANNVLELKGNKKSLGYVTKPHPQSFDVHEVSLTDEPTFYMFSDGLTDQIGGPKKIMYGKKRIIRKINEADSLNLTIQNISQDFEQYQGTNKRRDDISLFGFQINNNMKTVSVE
ncbi:MAG: SpoIIE family protein phosphatase [SAR324 cluster bacterium]|nr:SpoIIE family protein phosphatase [SAR324 cluster bacterium]